MGVEKNYRVDGIVKRRGLFTVHLRRVNGSRIGVEVKRGAAVAKKLDALIKLPYYKRKNTPVWIESGEIVDIILPE